ncbi:MAG: tRNA (adenosine(37)-N6)-threonylcarbamoyltransferase complex dimerization subunit type 1 TsaB [Acidobacteriota bacterium]|nr:tRNA (adenosine(37)-N6)-threonylcarbamoyltransferase complex dimerization subunit type 1 TsaB [Acidobacteriota bacterium]
MIGQVSAAVHSEPQPGRGAILVIDTCGAMGSVALATLAPEPLLLAQSRLPGRAASERLLPGIRDLLSGQGMGLGDLSAIAVVHGPGSFTGIRIGLSAAKGLCHALDTPLVGISRLAVLAGMGADGAAAVLSVLDAGRGEFYAGLYSPGAPAAEALRSREELLRVIEAEPHRRMIACESAVAEAFAPAAMLVAELSAGDALRMAARRILARDFDDPAGLDANYVRRTDLELFGHGRARVAAR